MAHLRLRLVPVRAQAEDQGHIGQVNAASLQLCQQGRENVPAGAGTGNIRGDNGDFFIFGDDFRKPGQTDGIFQGIAYGFLPGPLRRGGVHMQDPKQILFRNTDRLAPGSETKG